MPMTSNTTTLPKPIGNTGNPTLLRARKRLDVSIFSSPVFSTTSLILSIVSAGQNLFNIQLCWSVMVFFPIWYTVFLNPTDWVDWPFCCSSSTPIWAIIPGLIRPPPILSTSPSASLFSSAVYYHSSTIQKKRGIGGSCSALFYFSSLFCSTRTFLSSPCCSFAIFSSAIGKNRGL